MTDMDIQDDWDKTKENIRPVRQGLPSTALSFAEIVNPEASEELKTKRSEFEERIRTYSGDDPLSEIVSYINWIESAYPKGGVESGLEKLVKDCCFKYYNEAETREDKWHPYFDDERYVKLWLKMTRFANPFTIFSNMHKSKIGVGIPEVYISWATEVESLRNFEEAERILDLGIDACANNPENMAKLLAYRKQLVDRDCRHLIEAGTNGFVESSSMEEERSMLGGLHPVGKGKNLPPVSRIGENKLAIAKGVVPPRQTLSRNKPNPLTAPVEVFESSLDEPEIQPTPSFQLEDELFPRSSSLRENLVTSARLTKSSTTKKLSCRSHEPDGPNFAGFTILPDQNTSFEEEEKRRAEYKPTRLDKPMGKSSKDVVDGRPVKSSHSVVPKVKQCGLEAGCQSMWSTEKFPSGVDEYSFEESMAEVYRKRKLECQNSEDGMSVDGNDDLKILAGGITKFFDNLGTELSGNNSDISGVLLQCSLQFKKSVMNAGRLRDSFPELTRSVDNLIGAIPKSSLQAD